MELLWREMSDEPGEEHNGRWIVCRFPPQSAESKRGGTCHWKMTWFCVGQIGLGKPFWFPGPESEPAHKPSHWAFLHQVSDPDVIFDE